MKKLINWLLLAVLVVVTLPMVSCDDDTPKVNAVELTAANLQGTWDKGEVYKTIEKADVDLTVGLPTFTKIVFGANGALTVTTADGEVSGSYTLTGEELTLKAGDTTVKCKAMYQLGNKKNLSLSYKTTGVVGANEEEGIAGEKKEVTVTVHYSRNEKVDEE